MGRKLRDKLPQAQPPRDEATEAEWQILLRERCARRKSMLSLGDMPQQVT